MFLRIVVLLALLTTAQAAADSPLVIEDLQCRGNTATSCAYILSYMYLSAGNAVDEEEIRNAQFRLSALPNFTSVRIFLEKGSERGKAILVVEVAEANPLFTEALAGIANRGAHALAFRIGHQNLFGSGERLEFTASARIPVDGPTERDSTVLRLQYIDPTLFGAERWFFSASALHFDGRFDTRFGDVLKTDETGLDISIGRRLFDFSYVSLGYRYLFDGSFDTTFVRDDGFVEVDRNDYSRQILFEYGWNSEDDPYFPTQGGRLSASLAFALTDMRTSNDPDFDPDDEAFGLVELGYRHTWRFAEDNYLRLEIGAAPGTESRPSLEEDDGLTLAYERTLPARGLFSGIERGRWYVEAKYISFAISEGSSIHEVGLKAGLRLDTKRFGIVELYLLGTAER